MLPSKNNKVYIYIYFFFFSVKTADLKDAVDWMCPPEIHILKPNPGVMVLGGGAFGRWLDHEEEALRVGLVSW